MSDILELRALSITTEIADTYKVADPKTIALIQLGARKGLEQDPIKCTCISDSQDDAYEPGGPMSGHKRPPPCQIHSKKR